MPRIGCGRRLATRPGPICGPRTRTSWRATASPSSRPPTPTPPPTPRSTSTGTPATATPTSSATPAPTLSGPSLGGKGFTLRAGSAMSWTDGNVEIGYLILRTGASGPLLLPPGGAPLAFNATAYQDPPPRPD